MLFNKKETIQINSQSFAIFSGVAAAIVLVQIVRRVLPWLYANIIGPKFFGPRVDVRRLGDWAVVTGATDGIGKAYAKALAKKGLNLVLISRSPSKLDAVANEIRTKSQVEVKTVDVDFTSDFTIYDKIAESLTGLEIGVLVNNVGISYQHPEFFLECYANNPKFFQDIINVNVHSVLRMTALVLPGMVQRKKGAIINVSSTAGVIPNSLLSVYASTKAFVNKLSGDLNTEYRKQGIIIQSVQPGFVATNMTKIRKTSMFAPSADCYVASALKTLGIANQTAGYLPHAIMQLGVRAIAFVMGDTYANQMIMKNLLITRKKALRNLEKKK